MPNNIHCAINPSGFEASKEVFLVFGGIVELSLSFPVLADFGIISLLIIFSHLLRAKIKLLQNTYIPSSVIAGLIALFLGKQFIDIIPFSIADNNEVNISAYPSFLIVLLFSTIYLGKRKKKMLIKNTIKHAGDTFFLNLASILGQYGFSLLIGIAFLYSIFDLPKGFSLLLPAGFVGGHGTSQAIASVLEDYGFKGALSLGYTSATVGILVSLVGGMILVNIGTRLKWTRLVKSVKEMPISLNSGFVEESEQQFMGKETTSPLALDPLTWHFALVFGTAVFSYQISGMIKSYFNLTVPVFCVALLCGALVQKIFNLLNMGQFIDRHVIHRIGSMGTDFLVAFAVASISVHQVLSYALPLTILLISGLIFTLMYLWFLGKRMCHNFWFERSMMVFGWNTGTVASSLLLVRVIDPDMKSGVLEDFSLSYFAVSFVEISIISLVPHLVMKGYDWWLILFFLTSFILCILLSFHFVGWYTSSTSTLRDNEAEIVKQTFINE